MPCKTSRVTPKNNWIHGITTAPASPYLEYEYFPQTGKQPPVMPQ